MDLLTTRQVQDLLKVDRTTIYRMIAAGQLAAIRVGKQWRFERSKLLSVFGANRTESPTPAFLGLAGVDPSPLPASGARLRESRTPARSDVEGGLPGAAAAKPLRQVLSLDAAQGIQDLFATLLGVMAVMTTMDGEPITRVSNPCGYFAAIEPLPGVMAHCTATWRRIGSRSVTEPRLEMSDLGLLCTRGLIRQGRHLAGMMVVGGIAPDDWPPSAAQLASIAAEIAVPADLLAGHTSQVYALSAAERPRLLRSVQEVADIFTALIQEREHLGGKLEAIASLLQV